MFSPSSKNFNFAVQFYLFFSLIYEINAVHVRGEWNSQEFFLFLSKFGVQKTDSHDSEKSIGCIYGNVTSPESLAVPRVTLAVLDREYFLEYYGNRTIDDKEQACKLMFNKVSKVAFDKVCNKNGADYLRRVPCASGQLCIDEDGAYNVVKGAQFTFKILHQQQPRFWYVSLVACYFNRTSCSWHHFKENKKLNYDLWLVNGNPNNTAYSPFTYQFSFERQNTVELYLVFFVIYSLLLPVQLYAVSQQKHPVTRLFTVSLLLEVVGLFLNLLDTLRFSVNGEGFPPLLIIGDTLDILSRTTFMLLLLLLAKGWAVTRIELTWKPFVFFIWVLYGVVHTLLYVWNKTEVDIIEDIDEYQTWPGWFILVLRCGIIVWFLMELKTTMLYEHNTAKLQFFLHFGASALVWFIYLPIVAVIALQVPALWRFKLLLGITYSADCLAYCVMTHLLWPARSEQYFLLANPVDPGDELDEFNEAPHILNNYSASQPLEFNKVNA